MILNLFFNLFSWIFPQIPLPFVYGASILLVVLQTLLSYPAYTLFCLQLVQYFTLIKILLLCLNSCFLFKISFEFPVFLLGVWGLPFCFAAAAISATSIEVSEVESRLNRVFLRSSVDEIYCLLLNKVIKNILIEKNRQITH